MKANVRIRWAVRRDFAQIDEIDNGESYDNPGEIHEPFNGKISEEIKAAFSRNYVTMVAEHARGIVGYLTYEVHPQRLHLVEFAVHQDCRYQGVGSQMMDRLKRCLTDMRPDLSMCLSELNLDGHLFLQRQGFRCWGIVQGFFDWPERHDGYLFEFSRNGAEPCGGTAQPRPHLSRDGGGGES
jgi:ribosomal-protein-alanine N-acetyltransferase